MTSPPRHPLELDEAAMRSLLDLAGARVLAHVASLGQQPSHAADRTAPEVREPLPTVPTDPEALLDLLFEQLIPQSINTAGPGYLAYVPGGGLFHTAVADLIASSVNRYVGYAPMAPALVALERTVIRWFCEIVGFPAEAGGVLTTGGSLANLIALATARQDRLGESFADGVIYASDQVHHSVQKAMRVAGFPGRALRVIQSDARYRIDLDALDAQIRADRNDGLRPAILVGNAGSTNTGAVDDLVALADRARDNRLWLHGDGAYGGFFALTARGRAALMGLDRADSITLDPHKGLGLPYGTGCLLVRDLAPLRAAHTADADYLASVDDPEGLNFADLSPELSRGMRGLRVWLPMKMHGAGAFVANLDEKLDLAQQALTEIAALQHVEILAEPQLSILAFRFAPPGMSPVEIDALNHAILDGVHRRRRVYLSGTTLRGIFALRLAILSFRTHAEQVAMAIADLRDAAAEAQPPPGPSVR